MSEKNHMQLNQWPAWMALDEVEISIESGLITDTTPIREVYKIFEAFHAKTGNKDLSASLTLAWAIHRAALNHEAF